MNIYNEIWNNDENRLSVSKKNINGKYINPNSDILIDEQIGASGDFDNDLAKKPLFEYVNESKLNTPNFIKFKKLLNNYIVNILGREEYTQKELIEINEFLEELRISKVWKLTSEFILNNYNVDIEKNYYQFMFDLWFKIYTNWYNGRRVDYCTGFEHVFVGEGVLDNDVGVISGYHNWLKFYIDESLKRVNFHGHYYGLNNNDGPDNPDVVTLQMSWIHKDINGGEIYKLFKSRGGFFIGTSPECEICLAMVTYFEGQSKKEKRPLFVNDVVIGKGKYKLNLWRNTLQDGTAGQYVRSFFPMFLGKSELKNLLIDNNDKISIASVSQIVIKEDSDIIIFNL